MRSIDQPTSSPARYLWAADLDVSKFPAGSLIADRYRVVHSQVVVDTQSYRLPEIPDDFSEQAIAYLRLSKYLLHLPRPYGLLTEEIGQGELLLLENVPLDAEGQLLPSLVSQWGQVNPLRQINWLWQILQLWEPLADYNCQQSLLNPNLVRVDGCWVRLLQLEANQGEMSLSQLGDTWLGWLDGLRAEIAEPISELVYGLARGNFTVAEAAIAHLDRTARAIASKRPLVIRVASATDPGRRRDYNEDNCYPAPQEQTLILDGLQNSVAIVCDGLGGHEGGEVASRMAIESLCGQLEPLLSQIAKGEVSYNPADFMQKLAEIVWQANDRIVALNDEQQRTAQRRMGTTLVMTILPYPNGQPSHEVYVVHVGDSRVYWVTPESCRQVTLDDDVATRESTLGLNFYAYSAQRIDAGALIQALGTRSSDVLIPRVQRFILDDECLLLLCSDGLSDYDRVEELYPTHIRPILTDRLSLSNSCQNLINQGNFLNGHDNITVVLMRCQTAPYQEVDVAVQQTIARSRKFATKTTTVANPLPTPSETTQFLTGDTLTSIQSPTRLQTRTTIQSPTLVHKKTTPTPKVWVYLIFSIFFLSLSLVGVMLGAFFWHWHQSTPPQPDPSPLPQPPSAGQTSESLSPPP
ncbi:MAG: PP2C family protein-serine/threonine phosphatase [Pseudanabaenaceae cyanobacterium]